MKCPKCGKEIADESVFCGFCGARVNGEEGNPETQTNDSPEDNASCLLVGISFLFPIVGIIVYAINTKENPNKAKSCLKAALWGFGIGLAMNLIVAFAA